jgi:LmbE family N-acetylglucosaminyl deacetylase
MANILAVAPHPDDEVLGCGGVIARHSAKGDNVYVVVASKGVPEIFPPELVEKTRQETAAAAELLGTKRVFFLDFPAPRLDAIPVSSIADALKKVIVEVQPVTVYLPHHGDIHGDHKAVYWATLVASRPNGGFCPGRLLCYETPSETEWGAPLSNDAFVPTVFANISPYLDNKLEAMKCYRSQLAPDPNARSLASIE